MTDSIESGLRTEGLLPGRLKLERRAPELLEHLEGSLRSGRILSHETTLAAIYAVAVAEENAAGGRIVMAPTCGSAGVLPAVLKLLEERLLLPALRVHDALLVAGIVGAIVAAKASIAGAEVGCQGEVGTACAMAAAAACQVLGGSAPQAEAAAEMALEHHLGLTCDPVCGLVQIPCIERNAAAAVSALSAASLSLLGSGRHQISFDRAVATMRRIGTDMDRKYKETSLGGLALSADP
jgi:L-serine dehydratase